MQTQSSGRGGAAPPGRTHRIFGNLRRIRNYPNGPTESSTPTARFRCPLYSVGADDSVRPQNAPLLRKSTVNSQHFWAGRVAGPYGVLRKTAANTIEKERNRHMPSEFVFVPTPYGTELQEELAKALRARTEIISRKKNPRLWRMTDSVNRFAEEHGADDPVLKRRKIIQTVLSAVLAAAGVFLLVTGLMEPRNTTLLAAGVIALIIAAARLLPRPDAGITRQFQKSASLLLKSLGGMDLSSKPKIRFTDETMQIKSNQRSADFPYEKMETLVQTPRLFVLTHSGSATVLQKKDLISGTPAEFLDFFRAHTDCPCAELIEE